MSDQTDQRHTCPRRHENGTADPNSPFVGAGTNLDTWTTGHGLIGQETAGLSCSYCGSLHPDRFMELVRDGWSVGPTDKSYKAYISRPLTEEKKAERKAKWLAGFTYDEVVKSARERGETPEEFRAGLADYYDRDLARSEASGVEAKFYYQHLSSEQRDEFIELHNSRRMKISYPGRFYVLPFFAGPATA